MPVTLNSTGITFSDATTQNTAASAGATLNTNVTNYNASGNFDMSSALGAFVSVGGGGGGGVWNIENAGPEGAGGAGAAAFGFVPAAAAPGTSPVVIGGGGAGGADDRQNGRSSAGGNASFRSNLLIANGGSGNVGPNGSVSGNYLLTGCLGNGQGAGVGQGGNLPGGHDGVGIGGQAGPRASRNPGANNGGAGTGKIIAVF